MVKNIVAQTIVSDLIRFRQTFLALKSLGGKMLFFQNKIILVETWLFQIVSKNVLEYQNDSKFVREAKLT